MSNELMLHRGARIVSRDELMEIEAPDATSTWVPIKHGVVLESVEESLGQFGFSVNESWLALSKDDHRFFGVLHLQAKLVEGVSLSVGIRSSTDKSLPLGWVAGSRCFVCDNLSFSSEIIVSKRHTLHGRKRFNEGIIEAARSLQQFQTVEADRLTQMQQRELSADQADAVLLRAFERKMVGARMLPRLIKEWREPRHPEFRPRTAFSLLNCFTELIKPRFRRLPHRASYEMLQFQNLLN